ncbi:MAG: diguanylate cyclase, partial [Candidatus Marinimicrobia bacterium]|nr:diguanylate cyclase [Candidatus Neomarinimicrobiota bacterium]
KGQFVGFLGLDSFDKEAWGEEDLELASSFTNMFSISVWQIDVIDRQKNHIQFFQDVNKLNISLSLGVEQLDFYKVAANLSRKFFDFDKLTIAILKNEQEKELLIEYIDGYEADYGIGHQITVMGGLWENLIIKGQPVMVSDYDESDIEFRFQPGDKESFPFRSCLGIPLMVGRKRFGGLLLESFSTGNFLPEVAETLIFFGKNLSEMINRMNIYQSMKDLAMIDGLTGICNHRAFKERLQVEIDRCRRYGSTLTLFILDLDKFKRINDTYGHLYGDFVLKKISNIIRGSVRTVDTVARYGGEEFAVILINSDKKGCFNTAERIRSNIQSFLFEKDGMSERMTISIGMSEYPADGDDLQAIIANADMAMYQSKRDGGNKVVMYNPELES